MKTIIIASNNQHKLKEFQTMLKGQKILSLNDIGFTEDIDETGNTFEENATIKVQAILEFLNQKHQKYDFIIADDSGLCVPALGGAPGVYSARYAGGHGNDQANRDKLQIELNGKDRYAYFICCIVLYNAKGKYYTFEGKTEGEISLEERGSKAFGYDCIFFSHDLQKTFGEATEEEKNSVSHRGRAIEKMKQAIITDDAD